MVWMGFPDNYSKGGGDRVTSRKNIKELNFIKKFKV